MYEQVCYQKSFLKQVIARVDFVTPIDSMDKALPEKVLDAIVKYFPIAEPPQELAHHEVIVEADAVRSKRTTSNQLAFFSKDRDRKLSISKMAITVEYAAYNTFPEMQGHLVAVIDAFSKAYPEARASRVGLRFINQIDLAVDDATKWTGYLDPKLLEDRDFFGEGETLTRLMSIAELKYDDISLRFQYGMPNPDYPAPIKRPMFVLDLDGSISEVQELAVISANIERVHSRIQALFERSITDALREKMDAKPIQQ